MRALGYVNLAGVVILAALCAVQWRANRLINLKAVELDRVRQEQSRRIEDQASALVVLKADLEEFRGRLAQARDELDQTERELSAMTAARDREAEARARVTAERDQLLVERDNLKEHVETWRAAVEERDQALRKANDDILSIARQRDEAVGRFNDLAAKYNGVVKDLNEARSR